MRRPLPILLALLLLTAGCVGVGSAPSTPGDEARTASVTEVVDGDTLEVRFADGSTDTVRLLGVDSPETAAANEPSEFEGVPETEAGRRCLAGAGQNATAFVFRLVADATVAVVTDPVADRRGDYGRLLAYVELQNGTDVNERLLDRGHARVYDSTFSRSERYYTAESTAQTARRGLWRCRDPESMAGVDRTPLAVVDVHADADGNDNDNLNGESVTIGNEGEATLHLGGWTVGDDDGHRYTVPEGVSLDPDATVTLHTGSGSDGGGTLYWGADGAVWNNGGDTVIIRNASGAVVLEHRY